MAQKERGPGNRLLILGAVGTFVGTTVATIAALGGPEDAWLKTRPVLIGHPAPKIITVGQNRRLKGAYIVTLKNPALENVVVTGYSASPLNAGVFGDINAATNVSTSTDNGQVTVMGAEEQKPNECGEERYVSLPRPLVIGPREAKAIQVRPWREPCVFQIKFFTDHGDTEQSFSISA